MGEFTIKDGILEYYSGTRKDVVIPEGVTAIGDYAFNGRRTMVSVVIPEGVTTIGNGAFYECTHLVSVQIPAGVTSIGNSAFYYCPSLESVEIPDSVTVIGEDAFRSCQKLTDIRLPAGLKRLGSGAFLRCEKVTSVTLPQGLEALGRNVFDWTVKELTIPDSVTEMDGNPAYDRATLHLPENTVLTWECFIKDGVYRRYFGRDADARYLPEQVVIPQGVTAIAPGAFSGGERMRSLVIPESVTKIGKEAFAKCSNLDQVVIPKSVTEIGESAFSVCENLKQLTLENPAVTIGDNAFAWCPLGREQFRAVAAPEDDAFFNRIGFPGDRNGCLVEKGELVRYSGSLTQIVISEGVQTIPSWTLRFDAGTQVQLPESLKLLDEQNTCPEKMNLPKAYLQTRKKLPADYTLRLLNTCWKDLPTLPDYVALYLFQSSRPMQELCEEHLCREAEQTMEIFLQQLQSATAAAPLERAAQFARNYAPQISVASIQKLYDLAAAHKKGAKALPILEPLLRREENVPEPEYVRKLRETFDELELEPVWREHKCRDWLDLSGILLADGKTPAPAFVVKCAVVPYLNKGMAVSEWNDQSREWVVKKLSADQLEPEADRAAELLDKPSLCAALKAVWEAHATANSLLKPYCRYVSHREIPALVKYFQALDNWDLYGANGRKRIPHAQTAIQLSDAREAMIYCEKIGMLESYACYRGQDAEVLRDTVLCEFGLDENGQKTYDLGTKTVTATLNRDLTLGLYDNDAQKVVKSIPKKGTDPALAAAAAADLTAMKKNIKNVVKQRNARLWEEFLQETPRPAASWVASYTANPLLKLVAQLIVWKQGKATFLLNEAGAPISSDGAAYEITDEPISVAHPLEMEAADVSRWQEYFRSHGLKQPFEQIWEPAYDLSAIPADRYRGCQLSIFRFQNVQKHGIEYYDSDFHANIFFTLKDCHLGFERTGQKYRHELGKDETFTLGDFQIETPSRAANHIVYLLDKWTIQNRIRKDDIAAARLAEKLTPAQVIELLNLAIESNAPSCTAALLELKNTRFPDYDQEMEFLL